MRLLQTQLCIVMAEVLDARFVRFFAVLVQLGDEQSSARSIDEALVGIRLDERFNGTARAKREDRCLAARRRYDAAVP